MSIVEFLLNHRLLLGESNCSACLNDAAAYNERCVVIFDAYDLLYRFATGRVEVREMYIVFFISNSEKLRWLWKFAIEILKKSQVPRKWQGESRWDHKTLFYYIYIPVFPSLDKPWNRIIWLITVCKYLEIQGIQIPETPICNYFSNDSRVTSILLYFLF